MDGQAHTVVPLLQRTVRVVLHGLLLLNVAMAFGAEQVGWNSWGLGTGGSNSSSHEGVPPITMAAFKEGMFHSYATPRDAFAALDADLLDLDAALDEKPVNMKDFIRGTKKFQPPLSEDQATYAFKGLDVDRDGVVEVHEFVDGLHSGDFFRVTTTTTLGSGQSKSDENIPISMAEFKARMLRVFSSAPEAFAALDASETDLHAALDEDPINLKQFVQGSRAFSPPLTRTEAEFAFRALDADSNGILVSAEFSEGLAHAEFRPPKTSAQASTSTPSAPSTHSSTTFLQHSGSASQTLASQTPTSAPPPPPAPAPAPPHQLPQNASISMEEFKARMLTAHATALKAFQTLGSNPADLPAFIRGTKTFRPPLSEDQATYAFRGLDVDHDNSVSSFEFFEVLEFGRFFPKLRDLVLMGTSSTAVTGGTTPRPLLPGRHRPLGGLLAQETTPEPKGPGAGVNALKAVALITVCPLLCVLLPCARGLWEHVVAKNHRLESYKVVRTQSLSHRNSLSSGPRQSQYGGPKRSRLFGSGGLFGCCIQSSDETQDSPMLLAGPCIKPMERC